jgi:uncharacterized membrane protein YbaN (DUF454 family)
MVWHVVATLLSGLSFGSVSLALGRVGIVASSAQGCHAFPTDPLSLMGTNCYHHRHDSVIYYWDWLYRNIIMSPCLFVRK